MPSPLKQNWRYVLLLCMGVFFAFGNAFNGTFIGDDRRWILDNPTLSQPGAWLGMVLGRGTPDALPRPTLALSLVLDHALWGTNPRFYHLLNFGAHLASTLLLFSILRRTLESPRLSGAYGEFARPVACCAALLWGVHPLQTEAVTYIVQRADGLLGLFVLIAIYALIRGAECTGDGDRRPRAQRWDALALGAAVLGAGCTRGILALPVLALLYDRGFIAGTFASALRRAPRVYAGLFATWLIMGLFFLIAARKQFPGLGNGMPYSVLDYARSQLVIVACYLRLAVWPLNQCLDYAWPVEHDWNRIWPCAALLLTGLVLTLQGLVRNTFGGFWGAWSLLLLAPTSSFLPMTELAAERRLYLSLAGCSALGVCFAYRALVHFFSGATASRVLIDGTLLVSAALCVLSASRNALYQDELSMWQDVLQKQPDSSRALAYVGNYLLEHDRSADAEVPLHRLLQLKPDDPDAQLGFAQFLLLGGKFSEAEAAFRKILSVRPFVPRAWTGLAEALAGQHRHAEALAALDAAASYARDDPALSDRITALIHAQTGLEPK